jgi:tetratricopeptide (TPR) repeat protein
MPGALDLSRRGGACCNRELAMPCRFIIARSLPAGALLLIALCGPASGEHDKLSILQISARMVDLERAVQHALALPPVEHALIYSEQTLGLEHPTVAIYVDHLAVLNHALGESAKAELLFQRALGIQERLLGSEHVAVAMTLSHMAKLYVTTRRPAKAESALQRALRIREKALGKESPAVGATLGNLGALYVAEGRYAEAEPLLQQTLVIQEKTLGPTHQYVATSLENYAHLLRETHRAGEAAPLEARARAIRKSVPAVRQNPPKKSEPEEKK